MLKSTEEIDAFLKSCAQMPLHTSVDDGVAKPPPVVEVKSRVPCMSNEAFLKPHKANNPIQPGHRLYKTRACRNGERCMIKDCAFLHPGERPKHLQREERRSPPKRSRSPPKRSRSPPKRSRSPPKRSRSPRRSHSPKRPTVLVDGMNLCHGVHGAPPTARPLVRAIRHYEKLGYTVHTVLPEWAYYGGKDGTRNVLDANALGPYVRDRLVHFAPAYTDDDLFLLKFARERPNVRVLSNDHFQKHVRDGVVSDEWRRRATIKYMFIDGAFVPHK